MLTAAATVRPCSLLRRHTAMFTVAGGLPTASSPRAVPFVAVSNRKVCADDRPGPALRGLQDQRRLRGELAGLAVGETVILLHPPFTFSRCFTRDDEVVSAN